MIVKKFDAETLSLVFYFSSSGGRISKVGSLRTFLLAILFSKDNNNDGKSIRLEIIANNNVIETKPPKAMVPPKLETVKTKNPKKRTIEV